MALGDRALNYANLLPADYPAARDARLMRDLWCALMDPKP